MSVKALSWAWEQELAEGEKLLLMAIADHADDEGVCWPGQAGLARKIGRTDRTVRTRLVKLEALGLIARKPRYNAEGHRTSDMITLLMPTGKLCHRKTLPPEEAASGEPSGVLPTPLGSTTVGDSPTVKSGNTSGEGDRPNQEADEDRPPPVTVDRHRLTAEEWRMARTIMAEWNMLAGTEFHLTGTRGKATEHLKRIVGRIRENPEVTLDRHIEVVRYNCAHPWWQGKPTTIGVIYGPQAFPRCLAMGQDGRTDKRFADERRTAPEHSPW